MTGLPGRPLLIAFIVAAAFGLTFAATASAHAFLVRTTPQAGERLLSGPSEVILQFSEPVAAGSAEVTVRTAAGQAIALGPVETRRGGAEVRAGLPPLDEAIYLVAWQVLADDAHVSTGEFAFAVGASGQIPATAATSAAAISWPAVGASVLFVFGLALAIGGLASEAAIWGPVARQHGLVVPRAPVTLSLSIALLGAALSFLLTAGARAGGGLIGGLAPDAWLPALATRPGLLAAISVLLLAYALWIVQWQRVRPFALLPLAGAVVAAAWRGHAGVATEAGSWWAAPANALHLAGAGLWIGALVHLGLVLWRVRAGELRSTLGKAAHHYARLALPTVLVLLAAGLATAVAEFSDPAELIKTPYGRIMLFKLLFVLGALALALGARWRTLLPAYGLKLRLLRRLVTTEIVALGVVAGLSSLLVNTATPGAALAEADLLGPAPLEGPVIRLADQAGHHAVYLAAAEGELQIRVLEPGGEPSRKARLQIQGRSPGGAGLDLYPRSCGGGCYTLGFPWEKGTTRLSVAVSGSEWQGGVVEFTVPWPPAPESPEVLERIIDTMRAQSKIQMTERVSSGPGMTAGPYPVPLSGPQFIELESYVASGADDVRLLPSDSEFRSLVLFLPGSAMWYRLWFDAEYRLQREVIVNPGHLIERTFSYPAPERQ